MPETCPHCGTTGDSDFIARRDCCAAVNRAAANVVATLSQDNAKLLSILDDMDAAIATLYIGRDHGITPQADGAMRDVCIRIRDALSERRPFYAAAWAEARHTWERKGSALPVKA
jgi:hypothetical protein